MKNFVIETFLLYFQLKMDNADRTDDFGKLNGSTITNKSTILDDIDKALGCTKPPDIEFLFVETFPKITIFGFDIPSLPFGHAVVRYTYKGEQKIMNIIGYNSKYPMVNFSHPEDYLFGRDDNLPNPQGGIYNRQFVSVRFEKYDPQKIEWMDNFFSKLAVQDKEGAVEFSFGLFPIFNVIRDYLPFSIAKSGNCSYWASKGLVHAGLLYKPNIWPKSIWIQLFEKEGAKNQKNMHVVVYKNAKKSHRTYGSSNNLPVLRPTTFFNLVHNIAYYDLEQFADVIIKTDDDTAVIEKQKRNEPNFFRYHSPKIVTASLIGLYSTYYMMTPNKTKTFPYKTCVKLKKIFDIIRTKTNSEQINKYIKQPFRKMVRKIKFRRFK